MLRLINEISMPFFLSLSELQMYNADTSNTQHNSLASLQMPQTFQNNLFPIENYQVWLHTLFLK